jgi:hypothetical protein
MTESTNNFSSLRVAPFDGKKKEWITFEEKFLARAKHKGYKDVLMGKLIIPTDDLVLDPVYNEGFIKNRDMNELAYSDLILLMDTTESTGRVAFNIIKGSKMTDYLDGNAEVAWIGLK